MGSVGQACDLIARSEKLLVSKRLWKRCRKREAKMRMDDSSRIFLRIFGNVQGSNNQVMKMCLQIVMITKLSVVHF